MPERIPTLAPFRHEIFRTVWIASLASNFGGLIQAVGAAWMMTALAQSQDMVALVQASTALPIMLFSLIAGALADNYNRRSLMLTAQVFMLIVSVTLTVFAFLGLLTPWLLLTFTFLIGCGVALNNPSWQASVGDMVPREILPAAVTLNSVGFNITARSVRPSAARSSRRPALRQPSRSTPSATAPSSSRSSAGSCRSRTTPCRARRC